MSEDERPPARHIAPWDWDSRAVWALLKVTGRSQDVFAQAVGAAPRTVRTWLHEGATPCSGLARGLYKLWAGLQPWERDVFDALRDHDRDGSDRSPSSDLAEFATPLRMTRDDVRALVRPPTVGAFYPPASLGEEVTVALDRRAVLAGLGGAMAAFATHELAAGIPGSPQPELVDYFRAQLASHYRADMFLGPHNLIATVITQYWLIDELAISATRDVRRDLLQLAVAYAALAGWLYQDAGDLSRSSYWRSQALDMAHRCRDPQLVSYALTNKAVLRSDQRDGLGVVDLTTAALADERKLCPKARVMAMAHAAHGHALLGDRDDCERLLDRAAELAERVDDDYPWGNACRRTPGYLDVQRATCYGRMGLVDEGAQLWDRVLKQMPPSSRRDYGVYRARQATALASSQEPEQAVHIAAEVVPLALQTGSSRMHSELLALREAMAPWRHEAPGRELDELLTGITLPAPGES